MSNLGTDTLAIMGTLISVSVMTTIWLTAQFTKIERLLYRELAKRDVALKNLEDRALKLELKAFGYSPHRIHAENGR